MFSAWCHGLALPFSEVRRPLSLSALHPAFQGRGPGPSPSTTLRMLRTGTQIRTGKQELGKNIESGVARRGPVSAPRACGTLWVPHRACPWLLLTPVLRTEHSYERTRPWWQSHAVSTHAGLSGEGRFFPSEEPKRL